MTLSRTERVADDNVGRRAAQDVAVTVTTTDRIRSRYRAVDLKGDRVIAVECQIAIDGDLRGLGLGENVTLLCSY